ncbi:MAG TPA: hypothetical protein VMT87_14990 [Vicinamibacteria bacterium]|nr:hypothetical protein [Vicinamibacteria bacterium]
MTRRNTPSQRARKRTRPSATRAARSRCTSLRVASEPVTDGTSPVNRTREPSAPKRTIGCSRTVARPSWTRGIDTVTTRRWT